MEAHGLKTMLRFLNSETPALTVNNAAGTTSYTVSLNDWPGVPNKGSLAHEILEMRVLLQSHRSLDRLQRIQETRQKLHQIVLAASHFTPRPF